MFLQKETGLRSSSFHTTASHGLSYLTVLTAPVAEALCQGRLLGTDPGLESAQLLTRSCIDGETGKLTPAVGERLDVGLLLSLFYCFFFLGREYVLVALPQWGWFLSLKMFSQLDEKYWQGDISSGECMSWSLVLCPRTCFEDLRHPMRGDDLEEERVGFRLQFQGYPPSRKEVRAGTWEQELK